jgi:hypothetical protein
MARIDIHLLDQYRKNTFRTLPNLRVKNAEEAVEFVNERGFIFFWPIQGMLLPSLWVAAAGDRPIADDHDDPGHITWGWKDELLDKHLWYYGRILRRRNTILSLEAAPYFYALSENYGAPEEDYLLQYEQGRLTQEAKAVYEVLLREGPLDSIYLRKAAHLSNRENGSRFARALDDLQADFKVMPVGIADAGSWHYAFVYDITTHYYPDLPDRARSISEAQARLYLAEVFFRSLGAASFDQLNKCFSWRREDTQRSLEKLVESQKILGGLEHPSESGDWYAIPGVTA